MGNLPIEMEVSVMRSTLLSHLLYCNTVDINQILNIRIELLSILLLNLNLILMTIPVREKSKCGIILKMLSQVCYIVFCYILSMRNN